MTAENLKASAWHGEDGEVHSGLEVNARRVDFSGNKRREADDYAPTPSNVDDMPF